MLQILEKFAIKPHNTSLYEIALSHSSYANEHKNKKDYERLEFLGDAVLELIVSDYLYLNYNKNEGDMTKIRANYVCENALFQYMLDLDMTKEIKLGHGEIGEIKKAIVADIFEALMGAIYLDQGFMKVKNVLDTIIVPYILNGNNFLMDYKSTLQEAMQTERRSLYYDLIDENGPPHNKEFTVVVKIDNIIYGKGIASSKKNACQLAAKEALSKLAKK